MADEAPELLHLLKAGRILQYRQQNVALVSAAEGTEFDITYAERWLAPGLEVKVGDGSLVILSDSPYSRIDPVRYATVTATKHSRNGLQITIKVGPLPEDLPVVSTQPQEAPEPEVKTHKGELCDDHIKLAKRQAASLFLNTKDYN